MKKLTIILFALISILIISGCAIRTPQINGLVLDEETKQPVPEAWVSGMITIEYSTVAGKGIQCISIGQPHTRTDKDGKFVIPSGKFKGATFPFEFGNDVKHFGVGASTVDDRGGSISLMDALGKSKVDVTIYIKHEFMYRTESEYFTYLQSLYNYCLTGRFSVEVPAVESGCDAWELDYAIKKHERYLKRTKDDIKSGYYVALEQLAELYKRKNDYKKAIEIHKERINFIERHDLLKHKVWQGNKAGIEYRINELKKLLEQNSTK